MNKNIDENIFLKFYVVKHVYGHLLACQRKFIDTLLIAFSKIRDICRTGAYKKARFPIKWKPGCVRLEPFSNFVLMISNFWRIGHFGC